MSFGALAWGDPSAPLALMIHGYPDTAWTWRHLRPYLAERGWRAVAPFTRGYAPSELAPDDRHLIRRPRADILGLHEELGGDGRAVLIGHDWARDPNGAGRRPFLPLEDPDRVNRVITDWLGSAGTPG